MDRPQNPSRQRQILLPIIMAIGALALAAFMAFGGNDEPDPPEKAESNALTPADRGPNANPIGPQEPGAPTSLGAADAPVVMVAFSEFQCPFCGKFAKETLPGLIERYVDTGVLRIEWQDLPYLGDESFRAAFAARAAGEQDSFWEYHDVLFAGQVPKPNSGHYTDEYLLGVAGDLGLDVDRFEADYRSSAVNDAVRSSLDGGIRAGVNGTPAFFVNGTPVIGAQPLQVFVETIEAAANAS